MKYFDDNTTIRVAQAELELTNLWSQFHQETLENFHLLAGYIYSQEDLTKLIRERRPTFQYNLFAPIITRLLGGFKQSMVGVDFIPKNPNDQELAQVMKTVNDFILYQANDIEYEMSKAFLYAVVGRIGWIKQDYIYTYEHPDGIVDIKHYPSFKIKLDPNCQRKDLSDCNFLSDSGFFSPEEIVGIYAGDDEELTALIMEKSKELLGESFLKNRKNRPIKSWLERISEFTSNVYSGIKGFDSNKLSSINNWLDRKNGLLKVVDWYEKKLCNTMFVMRNNNYIDVTELVKKDNADLTMNDWVNQDKLETIRQPEDIIIERKFPRIFQISIIPALNIKLYDDIHPIKNYKFVPIYCYDFHPEIYETKSVIDWIKDPVRSANHRRNTMLTYITRVAHGGWLAEESAIRDHLEEFLSHEIGGVKTVRDGALTQKRIMPIEVPPMPHALDKLQLEDMEFVKIISGVRDNALASSESSQESGVLFRQKVLQSEIMQEWISDNAQSSLLQISRNNIEYIKKFFTNKKFVRILDKDTNDYRFLPINAPTDFSGLLINDVSSGEYDVVVSKTPYGRAQREVEFNKLVAIFQLLASINPQYVDPITLIKASGLKNSEEIIQHILNVQGMQQTNMMPQTQGTQQGTQPNTRNINMEELARTLQNAENTGLANQNY